MCAAAVMQSLNSGCWEVFPTLLQQVVVPARCAKILHATLYVVVACVLYFLGLHFVLCSWEFIVSSIMSAQLATHSNLGRIC